MAPESEPVGIDLELAQKADRELGFRYCRGCGCTDAHPCIDGCAKFVVDEESEFPGAVFLGSPAPPFVMCSTCAFVATDDIG